MTPSTTLISRVSLAGQETAPTLPDAIIQAVTYADVFDYPLSADEIHRYLIGIPAARDAVRAALDDPALIPRYLGRHDDFYFLPGREAIVETRRQRAGLAEQLWPKARRYGRILASFPFVRMVAVTGELAVDNVRPESDIDYFIITEQRRLWLCRGFALALVRSAAKLGTAVCPNYLLSERTLTLHEQDLYAAHEIAQMIPIAGLDMYARFRQANRWVFDYLPNAVAAPRELRTSPHGRPLRALAESLLRTPAGGAIEAWERERKVRKLSLQAPRGGEASFSADWCKGHYHNHGHLILDAFAERSRSVERLTS